jgi:hypothetical protein
MSRRSKANEILEKLTDIPEDCSDVENGIQDFDDDSSDHLSDFSDSEETSSFSNSDVESIMSDEHVEFSNECENDLNRSKKDCFTFSSESDDDELSSKLFPRKEIASDGTIWKKIKKGGVPGRLREDKKFKDLVGITAYAKKNIMPGSPLSAFLLVIDESILKHIITCTEAEVFRVLKKKWTITMAKLKAFIGLLYARGAYDANTLRLQYFWNKKWGPSFFSETMSRNDFTDILQFIRFDFREQRAEKLKTDKFTFISTVWESFIANSQICYKPGEFITVDEQLFPTKARCRFIQYMPDKPSKFGIKFWLASDVKTKYVLNGFPYLGKDEKRNSETPLGEFVVLELMKPYTGKERTVTTDNFFTSFPLADKLKIENTSLVGTLRTNKKQLPKRFKLKKDNLVRFSSLFYRSNIFSLTVYKSKPAKKVLILSTKHKNIKIGGDSKKLPETVFFYNKTKGGVDATDQMARKYTVKSGSRRWPLQVFFNILDLAGINSWILYKSATGKKISRKDFLFQLADELASEYVASKQKSNESNLSTISSSSSIVHERKWCQIGYCNNNKANNKCDKCKKSVCGKCTSRKICLCKNCD